MTAPADGTRALDWPGSWRSVQGTVEVLVGDVDAVRGPLPRACVRDLDEAGARTGEGRRLYLRRRGLLRRLIGRRLGIAADAVELGYGERGAPTLLAPADRLFVSVSARGQLAAFALADRPVGIDVEPLHDPGPLDVALAAGERAALTSLPRSERAAALLRLWTAKEAYLKAIGTGIARDPAGITVEPGLGCAFSVRDAAAVGAADGGRGAWWWPSIGGVPTVLAIYALARGTG